MCRLETVDPGLVVLVEGASDDRRRRAALAAAEFARARTGLSDQRVDALLRAVGQGVVGDTAERRAVDAIVESLDERQWDLQDRLDAGEAVAEDQLPAFALARAASAAAFAAEADSRVAAVESLYEAWVAVDDLEALRRVVVPALG